MIVIRLAVTAALLCTGLLLAQPTGPAAAADAVFPRTSRVGLVPPSGFKPSATFTGFEAPESKATIMLAEMPADAFATIEKGFTAETLKAQGVTEESREPFTAGEAKGVLVTGSQQIGEIKLRKWMLLASTPTATALVTAQVPESTRAQLPDETMRAALATLTVRAKVPEDELKAALPFALEEMSGFRIVRVLAGNAALMTAGPSDTVDAYEQPMFVVVMSAGKVPDAGDRDNFARQAVARTPGVKDMKVVRSEPLRIGGQQGHEIIVDGKDAKSNTPVKVVQWLRFASGGYVRMVGVTQSAAWDKTFPRFRAIRDGVALR